MHRSTCLEYRRPLIAHCMNCSWRCRGRRCFVRARQRSVTYSCGAACGLIASDARSTNCHMGTQTCVSSSAGYFCWGWSSLLRRPPAPKAVEIADLSGVLRHGISVRPAGTVQRPRVSEMQQRHVSDRQREDVHAQKAIHAIIQCDSSSGWRRTVSPQIMRQRTKDENVETALQQMQTRHNRPR